MSEVLAWDPPAGVANNKKLRNRAARASSGSRGEVCGLVAGALDAEAADLLRP
jgi:hypothetical protein